MGDKYQIQTYNNNYDKAVEISAPNPISVNYGPKESRRMVKNVVLISFALTLLFTAFQSMANLQSSLNKGGLATTSMTVLYNSLVVFSMFVATFLIRNFTVKGTLVVAVFGYSMYMVAQFFPSSVTVISGAIIMGFGAAPLWISKCTYLTHVGRQYTQLTGESEPEVAIFRFFGIFFLFFQSSSIWSNLISSAVLSQESRGCQNNIDQICGVNFCPDSIFCDEYHNSTEFNGIKNSTRYTLAGIYLACSLAAAVILAVFLDPLTRYGEKERTGSSSQLQGAYLLVATFRHMKNPYQLLLIPLTIWCGMQQGFFSADYTVGFVNCAWGIEKLGSVLICHGVVDAIGSVIFGLMAKYTGRLPIFVFGAMVNIAMIIVMLTWTPDPESFILSTFRHLNCVSSSGRMNQKEEIGIVYIKIFFVISGFWGLGNAVWQTQISGLYGVLFPQDEEPAFSNYQLWKTLGFIIAFVFSDLVCVKIKLYILVSVIIAGMMGYLSIEAMQRKKQKFSHL